MKIPYFTKVTFSWRIWLSLIFLLSIIPFKVWATDANNYIGEDKYPPDQIGFTSRLNNEILPELEAEVDELIADGDMLAPAIYQHGLGFSGVKYYNLPSEVAHTLLSAYPYLSSDKQDEVKSYLDTWFFASDAKYPLLNKLSFANTDVENWERREYYDYSQSYNSYPLSDKEIDNGGYPLVNLDVLSTIWLYVDQIDDSYLDQNYDDMKQLYESYEVLVAEYAEFDTYSELSGMIGMYRLATRKNDTSFASEVKTDIQNVMDNLDFSTAQKNAKEQYVHGGGHSLHRSIFQTKSTKDHRNFHFSKDIFQFIADNDSEAASDYVDDLARDLPLWWVVGAGITHGENLAATGEFSWTGFMIEAYIKNTATDVLIDRYLSRPDRKGDLFYIQKLVAIVDSVETFSDPVLDSDQENDALDFGSVQLGSDQQRTVYLSNIGNNTGGTLSINDLTLAGDDAALFSIESQEAVDDSGNPIAGDPNCLEHDFSFLQQCKVVVSFNTRYLGEASAQLDIDSTGIAPDTVEYVALSAFVNEPPLSTESRKVSVPFISAENGFRYQVYEEGEIIPKPDGCGVDPDGRGYVEFDSSVDLRGVSSDAPDRFYDDAGEQFRINKVDEDENRLYYDSVKHFDNAAREQCVNEHGGPLHGAPDEGDHVSCFNINIEVQQCTQRPYLERPADVFTRLHEEDKYNENYWKTEFRRRLASGVKVASCSPGKMVVENSEDVENLVWGDEFVDGAGKTFTVASVSGNTVNFEEENETCTMEISSRSSISRNNLNRASTYWFGEINNDTTVTENNGNAFDVGSNYIESKIGYDSGGIYLGSIVVDKHFWHEWYMKAGVAVDNSNCSNGQIDKKFDATQIEGMDEYEVCWQGVQDKNATPDDFDQWDSTSVFVNTLGNQGELREGYAFRFDMMFTDHTIGGACPSNESDCTKSKWRTRKEFNKAYYWSDDDDDWKPINSSFPEDSWDFDEIFSTVSVGSGGPSNHREERYGYKMRSEFPWESFGLDAPPHGQTWGWAVRVHDRDDAQGTIDIPAQAWPSDDFDETDPTTWGQLSFSGETYKPFSEVETKTIKKSYGVDYEVDEESYFPGTEETVKIDVADAYAVGSVGDDACADSYDSTWQRFTEWPYETHADDNIYMQNQENIADWPCFGRAYYRFDLSDDTLDILEGKNLISVRMTLSHIANTGTHLDYKMLTHVFDIDSDEWKSGSEANWNNAPKAKENFTGSWFEQLEAFAGTDPIEVNFDVSDHFVETFSDDSETYMDLATYITGNQLHMGGIFCPDPPESGEALEEYESGHCNGHAPYLEITYATPQDAPVAKFDAVQEESGEVTGNAPYEVHFQDLTDNPPATHWSWDFGDGSPEVTIELISGGTELQIDRDGDGTFEETTDDLSLKNPTHIYQNSGTFNVSLFVKNSQGSNLLTKDSYVTIDGCEGLIDNCRFEEQGLWEDRSNSLKDNCAEEPQLPARWDIAANQCPTNETDNGYGGSFKNLKDGWVESPTYSSNRALRISKDPDLDEVRQTITGFEKGKVHQLSGWYQCETFSGEDWGISRLRFVYTDGNEQTVPFISKSDDTEGEISDARGYIKFCNEGSESGVWKQFVLEFETPDIDGVDRMDIRLGMDGPQNDYSFYFDDLILLEKDEAPLVDLKINHSDNPLSIDEPANFELQWTASSDAENCEASGDWSGSTLANGSKSILGKVAGTYTYTLTCDHADHLGDPNYQSTDSVTMMINDLPGDPELTHPEVTSFTVNGSTEAIDIDLLIDDPEITLDWTTERADSCEPYGNGWEQFASSLTSLEPDAANETNTQITLTQAGLYEFGISCTNGDSGDIDSQASVLVNVEKKELVNNLFDNGDFEKFENGKPTGWDNKLTDGDLEKETFYSSSHAIEFSKGGGNITLQASNIEPIETGKKYMLSFQYLWESRTDTQWFNNQVHLKIKKGGGSGGAEYLFDGDVLKAKSDNGGHAPDPETWRKYEHIIDGSEFPQNRLYFELYKSSDSPTVYVDDFQLYEYAAPVSDFDYRVDESDPTILRFYDLTTNVPYSWEWNWPDWDALGLSDNPTIDMTDPQQPVLTFDSTDDLQKVNGQPVSLQTTNAEGDHSVSQEIEIDISGSQHPLTVTTSGSGTITSDPVGIDCGTGGTDCEKDFSADSNVTLTANAATGSTFERWRGDACDGDTGTTCDVLMNEAKSVEAEFASLPDYTITTSVLSGQGSVEVSHGGSDQDCSNGCSFPEGSDIDVTAKADSGYVFSNWNVGGSCNAQDESCTFILDADETIEAEFNTLPSYSLDLAGASNGTVEVIVDGDQKQDCTSGCSISVHQGALVQITATADSGYQFDSWGTGNSCSGEGNSCSFDMTKEENLSPTFSIDSTPTPYACSLSGGSGGISGVTNGQSALLNYGGLDYSIRVGENYDSTGANNPHIMMYLHGDPEGIPMGSYYKYHVNSDSYHVTNDMLYTGGNGRASQFDGGNVVSDFADEKGWIYIGVRAGSGSNRWYDDADNNVSKLDNLIQHVMGQYNVCEDELFSFGVSGGATFLTQSFIPQKAGFEDGKYLINTVATCGGGVNQSVHSQVKALDPNSARLAYIYGDKDYVVYDQAKYFIRDMRDDYQVYIDEGFQFWVDETAGMAHCGAGYVDLKDGSKENGLIYFGEMDAAAMSLNYFRKMENLTAGRPETSGPKYTISADGALYASDARASTSFSDGYTDDRGVIHKYIYPDTLKNQTETATFTISNPGTEDLEVYGVYHMAAWVKFNNPGKFLNGNGDNFRKSTGNSLGGPNDPDSNLLLECEGNTTIGLDNPVTLSTDESCTFEMQFNPGDDDEKLDKELGIPLRIHTNANNDLKNFQSYLLLEGTGVDSLPPIIEVSTESGNGEESVPGTFSYDYGEVLVNEQKSETFTITNRSSTSLNISNIVKTSGAGAQYRDNEHMNNNLTNDAPISADGCTVLGEDQSCSFDIIFTPQKSFEDAAITLVVESVELDDYTIQIVGDGVDAVTQHELSVDVEGSGSVESISAGIDCGTNCAADFNQGTTVSLQANADNGSSFLGWSGDACDGDTGTTCDVFMNEAKSVTAQFASLPEPKLEIRLPNDDTALDPLSFSFPDTQRGNTNSQVFRLYNVGEPDSSLVFDSTVDDSYGIVKTDGQGQQFNDMLDATNSSIGSNGTAVAFSGCASVDHGSYCTIEIGFAPSIGFGGGSGTEQATLDLTLTSNDPAGPVVFALKGNAVDEVVNHTLTTSTVGNSSGTVEVKDEDSNTHNCDSGCTFLENEKLTLSATVGDSNTSQFTQWVNSTTGTCAGRTTTPCVFQITQDETIEAQFDLKQYALTLSATGQGTISSDEGSLACQESSENCEEEFDHGTSIILTAAPASGYQFDSWIGCPSESGNQCQVALTSMQNVSANFTLQQYTLRVEKIGSGEGGVQIQTSSFDQTCSETDYPCEYTFDYDTALDLTALSDTGSEFAEWSNGCGGTDPHNDCDFNLTTDTTIVTKFDLQTFQITFNYDDTQGQVNGGVSNISVDYGQNQAIEILPLTNYLIGQVVIDTITQTISDPLNYDYVFNAITQNHQVDVTFVPAEPDIAVLPTSVVYGDVLLGNTSSRQITVRNEGNFELNFDNTTPFILSGTNASEFNFDGSACTIPDSTLDPAEECVVSVDFFPISDGSKNAVLQVMSDDPDEGTTLIALDGIGTTAVVAPTADFTADMVIGSGPLSVNFVDQSTNSPDTWEWDFDGDGNIDSTDQNPNHVFDYISGDDITTNKTFTVRLTVTNDGGGNSDSKEIIDYITLTPALALSFTLPAGAVYQDDGMVSFDASATVGSEPLSYWWDFNGDGSPDASGVNASYDFTGLPVGVYPIKLTVIDAYSENVSLTQNIVIQAAPTANFTLEKSSEGSGEGEVMISWTDSSGAQSQSCDNSCTNQTVSIDRNTEIQLTAIPDSGSRFVRWESSDILICDDLVDVTCTFELGESAANVQPVFERIPIYDLTVTLTGDGTGAVVSSPGGIDCGLDCNEAFEEGTPITLSVASGVGSDFASWGGACAAAGNSSTCLLMMNELKNVTANFVVQQVVLTTDVTAGQGSVTVDDGNVTRGDCTSGCFWQYNTVVTLEAIADSVNYYEFDSWSGCAAAGGTESGNQCQNVTLTSDITITATFTISSYELHVSTVGTGSGGVTGSPGEINCGIDCSENFSGGTSITLIASPAAGSMFVGWSGDCSGVGSCEVTMDRVKSVVAEFSLIPSYALNVTKSGTGSGIVTSSFSGIDCGLDCTEDFEENTMVILIASPAAGSTFVGWSGDCSGVGSCEVTMDRAKSVVAEFSMQTFTLTPIAGMGGSIAPNTAQIVNHSDDSSVFTVTAGAGYQIETILVNGLAITLTDPGRKTETYTFINVASDQTISAQFAMEQAVAELNLTNFDFGEAPIGTSGSQIFTLTNDGNIPLTLGSIHINGDSVFTLVGTTCGSSLNVGDSCILTVAFAPTDEQSHVGEIEFTTNDPSNPNVIIPLSGEGSVVVVPPVASFTPNILSGEAPLVVSFVDTSSNNPTSWSWDFGNGKSSTEPNPINIEFSRPGSYNVTLVVSNEKGSDEVSQTIVVHQPPLAPVTLTPEAPDTCEYSVSTSQPAQTLMDCNHPIIDQIMIKFSQGMNGSLEIQDEACGDLSSINQPIYTCHFLDTDGLNGPYLLEAELIFIVSKQWVAEKNIDPATLTILHRGEGATGFEDIGGVIIQETAESYSLKGTTDRFSEFVVSGQLLGGNHLINPVPETGSNLLWLWTALIGTVFGYGMVMSVGMVKDKQRECE